MDLFLKSPEKISFDKPSDILTAVLFLRYGKKLGDKNLQSYYENFKSWDYLNGEYIANATNFIVGKTSANLVDYKTDYAKLFYNYGKLILLALSDVWYEQRYIESVDSDTRHNKNFIDRMKVNGAWIGDPLKRGALQGILSSYCELASYEMRKLSRDFAQDQIDSTISPIVFVKPYFDENALTLNEGETLAIIATALYSSALGFFMSNLENNQLKEAFKFGEDMKDISGKKFVESLQGYGIDSNKFAPILRFLSIYSTIVNYIEKMTGKVFNDRFAVVFKAIGEDFNGEFDKRIDLSKGDDAFDKIIDGLLTAQDAMVLFARELTSPVSLLYIGDSTYDYRKIFYRQIRNPETGYRSVYNEIIKDDFYSNFDDLKNYTAILDVKSYGAAVKYAIMVNRWLQNATTSASDEYVQNYYKLKYIEKLISNAYTYWSGTKNPFNIVGVEDICIEATSSCGINYLDWRDVNSIPYGIAYDRAMKLINEINARYCEAYEFEYARIWARGIRQPNEVNPELYYRSVDSVKPTDHSYDSVEDAVRTYVSGKLPYLATIGSMSHKELTVYVDSNVGDIDFSKLSKLNALDKNFVNDSKSPSLSPFEVVKSGGLDESVLSSKDSTKKLADILRNLNNREVCYLSR